MRNLNMVVTFKSALEVYKRYSDPVCKKFHLPRTAYDILFFLANNPDACTAKEISELRGIKASLMSMHVDTLVRAGFLERQTMPDDRRKIRLLCTPQAAPVIEQGRAAFERFVADAMAGIPPEELEVYKRCTLKVSENILAIRASGDAALPSRGETEEGLSSCCN